MGRLKRIIYHGLKSSLHVKKDKSCSTLGTYQLQHQLQGEGKAPSLQSQTGCLALQVSGSLQETAARPGCYCLPSTAQEGTQTAKRRKQRQRDSGGEGGLLSSHGDRARQKNQACRAQKQLKGQVPTRTLFTFRQRSPSFLNSHSV